MSFEVLATIVVINAVVTFSLWRQVARKANRHAGLNKKAANALWRSEPIVPRHDPPKTAGGEYPSFVHDVDQLFFVDFRDFADVVNWWLSDEFTESRFRLQDMPAVDVSLNRLFRRSYFGAVFRALLQSDPRRSAGTSPEP